MVDSDRQNFAAWYTNLAIATRVPKHDVSARVIEVMFGTLKGLPAEAVKTAAADLQRTEEWMPTASRWAERAEAFQRRQAQPSGTVVRLQNDIDPTRTAQILAARKQCVADIRALPTHHSINWQRIADAIERMPFALPPAYYCDKCDDTGMGKQTCEPGHRCGKTFCQLSATDPTYTHPYRILCDCRPMNPHLQALDADYEHNRTTRSHNQPQRGRR